MTIENYVPGIWGKAFKEGYVRREVVQSLGFGSWAEDIPETFVGDWTRRPSRDHGATGYALAGEPIRLPGTL